MLRPHHLWLALLAGCGQAPVPEREAEPEPTAAPVPTPHPVEGRLAIVCDASANPLRATCAVDAVPPGRMSVRVEPDDGTGGVQTMDLPRGTSTFTLTRLAPDRSYTVRVTRDEAPVATATTSIRTGVVPPELDTWLHVEGTSSVPFVGTHHPCNDRAVAVVYDTATGDLVWFEDLDPAGTLDLLHMVRFLGDGTVIGNTGASIVQVDGSGERLIDLRYRDHFTVELHHDIALHDGLVYGLTRAMVGEVLLDDVVALDATSGEVIARWHAAEHLDIPADATGDWMHTNTVFVDDAGDVYLSLLSQAAVIALDGDLDSAPRWVLSSPPTELPSDWVLDWDAAPAPHSFDFQHDVSTTADGRVVFLDNAGGRGLVVALDPDRGVATVTGAYPTSDLACGPQGTAALTGAGGVMVACTSPRLREYAVDASVVTWEASVGCAEVSNGFEDAPSAARWYPLITSP